jgi:hypothetical protein
VLENTRRCIIADFLRAGDEVLTTSMAWERRELFLATGHDLKRASSGGRANLRCVEQGHATAQGCKYIHTRQRSMVGDKAFWAH